MSGLCNFGGYCVRTSGHAGAHTACPSACTLDWDRNRKGVADRHTQAAAILEALDFPTPAWADESLSPRLPERIALRERLQAIVDASRDE